MRTHTGTAINIFSTEATLYSLCLFARPIYWIVQMYEYVEREHSLFYINSTNIVLVAKLQYNSFRLFALP